MKRAIALSLSAVLVFSLTAAAQAAPVYGTAADLTGDRSVGSGLEVVDAHTPQGASDNWDNAAIEWEITANGLSFDYKYIFKDFNQPAISHLTLDLTDDAVNDPDAITNVKFNGVDFSDFDLSTNTGEGITGGVKFDSTPDPGNDNLILTFTSNRAPVWGDIAIEVGQDQAPQHFLVQNTGFGDQVSENTTDYVARPNGTSVPSPAAATAGLMLLGGLAMRRRRR